MNKIRFQYKLLILLNLAPARRFFLKLKASTILSYCWSFNRYKWMLKQSNKISNTLVILFATLEGRSGRLWLKENLHHLVGHDVLQSLEVQVASHISLHRKILDSLNRYLCTFLSSSTSSLIFLELGSLSTRDWRIVIWD